MDSLSRRTSEAEAALRRMMGDGAHKMSTSELVATQAALLAALQQVTTALSAAWTRAEVEAAERSMCLACEERECTVAFVPCGHMVLCAQCADCVALCPVDRAVVKQRLVVYRR